MKRNSYIMYWTFHRKGTPNCSALAVIGDKIYCFEQFSRCVFPDHEPMRVYVVDCRCRRKYTTILPKPGDEQYDLAPTHRHGHTAVAYGSNVYVWGGRNVEDSCDKLYCFDTIALQWSRPTVKGDVPKTRLGHTACVVGDCMYVYGGMEYYTRTFSKEVFVLDLVAMKWRCVMARGEPACPFSSMSVLGNRIYMFCGCENMHGSCQGVGGMNYFDTVNGTWHKPPRGSIAYPIPVRCRSTFVYGKHIFVCGELDGMFGSDVYRYSPDKCEWDVIKTIGNAPIFYNALSCVVVKNQVFFFGWRNDLHILEFAPTLRTLCLNAVLKYDLDVSCLPEDIKRDLYIINNNFVDTGGPIPEMM